MCLAPLQVEHACDRSVPVCVGAVLQTTNSTHQSAWRTPMSLQNCGFELFCIIAIAAAACLAGCCLSGVE
jgi:hypothetical protein